MMQHQPYSGMKSSLCELDYAGRPQKNSLSVYEKRARIPHALISRTCLFPLTLTLRTETVVKQKKTKQDCWLECLEKRRSVPGT